MDMNSQYINKLYFGGKCPSDESDLSQWLTFITFVLFGLNIIIQFGCKQFYLLCEPEVDLKQQNSRLFHDPSKEAK